VGGTSVGRDKGGQLNVWQWLKDRVLGEELREIEWD